MIHRAPRWCRRALPIRKRRTRSPGTSRTRARLLVPPFRSTSPLPTHPPTTIRFLPPSPLRLRATPSTSQTRVLRALTCARTWRSKWGACRHACKRLCNRRSEPFRRRRRPADWRQSWSAQRARPRRPRHRPSRRRLRWRRCALSWTRRCYARRGARARRQSTWAWWWVWRRSGTRACACSSRRARRWTRSRPSFRRLKWRRWKRRRSLRASSVSTRRSWKRASATTPPTAPNCKKRSIRWRNGRRRWRGACRPRPRRRTTRRRTWRRAGESRSNPCSPAWRRAHRI
mmetsp:Transcript_2883/g.5425  ORF Transcript_2883/g.5425 Transcript_2883/m.5425 type:complete len:287 (+) Transcript_2883:621-1481(+)